MLRASVATVILVAIGGLAWATKSDWTGSAACGNCHPAELAAWKLTAHATTAKRLPPRPESKCLTCHGTGEAPAGPTIAVEVGCESCHGAGAGYGEDDVMRDRPVALALGLVDLSTPKVRAAVCAQCHLRPTRAKPFDPASPVHPVPKK